MVRCHNCLYPLDIKYSGFLAVDENILLMECKKCNYLERINLKEQLKGGK